MPLEIANNLEIFFEPGLRQHKGGIAAYLLGLVFAKYMLIVKGKLKR